MTLDRHARPLAGRPSQVKDPLSMAAISHMPKIDAPEAIEHQRLRLLFRQSHTTSVVAAIGAFLCAMVFYANNPGTTPLVWLGAVLIVTGLRFGLYKRFFATDIRRFSERHWLQRNALTAMLAGLPWGMLPLIPVVASEHYIRELQTLVPGFVLLAAISSYGVYFSQYLALWASVGLSTIATRIYVFGVDGAAEVLLFAVFLPVLLLTAKRYNESLFSSMHAKFRSEQLVQELTASNNALEHHNSVLGRQQDVIQQEEELAKHVFRQLTLGGDHELPGVHTWNQSMGSLSGDLIQTARGPDGQAYVFLGDFTGHGLPAALGALPASSVFLAMAAKGLPAETIATELNRKLHQLLPVGYFCCAVLFELSPDRRTLHVWNGGLPPVLILRKGASDYEKIPSHSVPLGVLGADEFHTGTSQCVLEAGDVVYAYTDGLTEAEDLDGEMLGAERLEQFLLRDDLDAPKLPALIEVVLEHVNLAPASDDISVVELVASAAAGSEANAA